MADETVLWQRSATELAALIAARTVKSREVVDAHLDRIAEVNPRLNAITVVLAESARVASDAADDAVAAGRPLGPLHGVPFTIKENIDLAGSATTNGVAALADAIPSIDSVTVERMKAAGAIPLGRTNMPEFGLRVSTDNAFRGLTRNPWHHDRTAGGSSGGEGSTIASGMSPLGLGNDIGGSIRNPALCCGAVGLKPTPGRVPAMSVIPPVDPGISGQLMSVEGPLARTVADLRAAIGIMAGAHHRDVRSVPASLTGPPAPQRAGIVRHVPGVEMDPGARAAIDDAESALVDAGWEVEPVDPPELERVADLWKHLLAFDLGLSIPLLAQMMGPAEIGLLQELVDSCDLGALPPQLLFIERRRLMREWNDMFERLPVLVGPGWTKGPFDHGADVLPGRGVAVLTDHLGFVVPANLLGLPVAAVANGVTDGMPYGVQVYAAPWREDLCLDAAEVVQQASGVLGPKDPVW